MATNLQIFGRFSGRVDGEVRQGGTVERPINVAIAGIDYSHVFSVANSANTTIYSANLADFNFIWIASDYTVAMKITDTNSNTFRLALVGSGVTGRYGIPFMLGDDGTTGAFTINTVQVFNTSGNTAKIRIYAAT